MKKIFFFFVILAVILQSEPLLSMEFRVISKEERKTRRQEEIGKLQERFHWWPTDAIPGPVRDEKCEGYWWWPKNPGEITPWGNRGYVYVYKIILDYKAEELPPPKPEELRPSLLIKKVIKNIKIYFDYDKADLRADHVPILEEAVRSLKKNPGANILITGNCDKRGSEAYNQKLGNRRGQTVKNFMIKKNIPESRIRIVSKGKLDAIAPISDLVGMQKDRNAQFMIAEVEEIMIPYKENIGDLDAKSLGEGKYLVEKDVGIESQIKVATREYVVKEQDTLKSIAQEQLGAVHRWKYLYEFNKNLIKNPDFLETGTVIIIPVEQEEHNKTRQAISASSPATRSYTVTKSDSLWKIAKTHLGNGERWKEIYELNKDKIKSPDKLAPGMKIILPAE